LTVLIRRKKKSVWRRTLVAGAGAIAVAAASAIVSSIRRREGK
jgi:hypothetical protein